jgi:hypothetical protein
MQRCDVHPKTIRGLRQIGRQPSGEALQIRPNLLNADRLLEPCDDGQVVRAALQLLGTQGGRYPQFDISAEELESGGHDAHDTDTPIVQDEVATNDCRIVTEVVAPEGVAQDGHTWSAWRVLVGAKCAPERRGHAEDVEEIVRDAAPLEPLRPIAAQCRPISGEGGD